MMIKKEHIDKFLTISLLFLIVSFDNSSIIKAYSNDIAQDLVYTSFKIDALNGLRKNTDEINAFIQDYSFDDVKRCYEIANNLVGRTGSCIYICKEFIREFYGEEYHFKDIYEIDTPRMGDIIYYDDAGTGIEHWAIYLDEEHSLQGNFNGYCIIMDGYHFSSCDNPVYYRVMKTFS